MNTTEQFNVTAHNGPNGPSGTIVVHSPLYSVDPGIVDVTCIVVDGNQTRVGGTFRQPFEFLGSRISTSGSSSGTTGRPAKPRRNPSRGVPRQDTPARVHTLRPAAARMFPLDSGNYVVRPGAG